MDERRQLAHAIARNRELYDVVSRHGLTEHDLLEALRTLQETGHADGEDLWAIVTYAARRKELDPLP